MIFSRCFHDHVQIPKLVQDLHVGGPLYDDNDNGINTQLLTLYGQRSDLCVGCHRTSNASLRLRHHSSAIGLRL